MNVRATASAAGCRLTWSWFAAETNRARTGAPKGDVAATAALLFMPETVADVTGGIFRPDSVAGGEEI